MTSIPIKPIAFKDESPLSLLIRAAHANGHLSIFHLLSGFGYKTDNCVLNADINCPKRYKKILNLLGLNVEHDLVLLRAGPTSRSPRIFGKTKVPDSLIRKDGIAYCSKCLVEKLYFRSVWMLIPYTVCLKHKCLIQQACQKCGSDLKQFREMLHICNTCGNDIRSAKETLSPTTSTKWLMDLIQKPNQFLFDKAHEIYEPIKRIYDSGEDQDVKIPCIEVAYLYLKNRYEAVRTLIQLINKRSHKVHPRIQLLPLLLKGKIFEDFAEDILNGVNPPPTPRIGETRLSKLTKQECCKALKISALVFSVMIKNGELRWCKDSKKEKVETKAIEAELVKKDNRAFKKELLNLAKNGEIQFSLNEIAELLKVNYEIVRSLTKIKWLPFNKKRELGHVKVVVNAKDFYSFNENYILIGTLAKSLDVNPRNLGEKILTLGVKPVGGPKIDGLKTTIYKRKHVQLIDRDTILGIEKYETCTGRKPLGYKPEIQNASPSKDYYLLSEASSVLEVSIQKVIYLVNNGYIERYSKNKYLMLVDKESLVKFKENIDRQDFIHIADAIHSLGCTKSWFYLNLVKTEFIKVHDYQYWKFITQEDILKVNKLRGEYLTATEASRLFDMKRHHVANLEKMGLIKSHRIHEKSPLRLYRRDDVVAYVQKTKNVDKE